MPAKPKQTPAPGGDANEEAKTDQVLLDDEAPATAAMLKQIIKTSKNLQNTNETNNLVDIPCVYLNDRSVWPDFKRAIHECGLIWGLPDWMTTITYKGIEWQNLQVEHATDLSVYFPPVDKAQAGDGLVSKSSALGIKLAGLLGRPKSLADTISNVQFCCLTTVEYETERKLPARQKLWSWMVRSLRGNKPTQGPYHYLVDEMQTYDISYLFKRLIDVLEQVTICSLDDELEIIIKMDFKPTTQNIFSYLGELKKSIKRLNDINERLPLSGRIVLPDSYIRSRLVRAARQVPVYKPVLDRLLITPMDEWTKLTSDDLYHQLEAVCANDQSVSATRHSYAAQSNSFDSLSANSIQFKEKQKEKTKPDQKQPCRNYSKGVPCATNPCKYQHPKPDQNFSRVPQDQNLSRSASQVPRPPQSSRHCNKCDSVEHWSRECKYNGKCTICAKIGHKEAFCIFKDKQSKPRANYAQFDGEPIYANMLSVQNSTPHSDAPFS